MSPRRPLVAAVLLAALGGCRCGAPAAGPEPTAPRDDPPAAARRPAPRTLGGARPATVIAPRDGAGPLPLVLVLHGYGDTGMNLAEHLGYVALARRERLVLVVPDGTPDRRGARFWNATDACCDFERRSIDDVAYLRGLVAEAKAAFPVDPARVYVVGLSNGGFMAHRLACDAADDFAAILSIAGVPWQDAARCKPARRVSVLQVHGDRDRVVAYPGGDDLLGLGGPAYPGATAAVTRWAALDACGGPPQPTSRELELDPSVPGAETLVHVAPGCPDGVGVELWTMRGAPHVPAFADHFAKLSFAWLQAHPKAR
jgi:polyhydroxybutyrate depolymerase